MAEKLAAELRTDFGKGASRRLRREAKLPAVVYGHGEDPVHIALDYHDSFLAVRGNANALVELNLDGETQIALVKDIQRNPLTRMIEHMDLLRVKRGEKVEVVVPIVIEGEPFGEVVATLELMDLPILAPVTAIPDHIVVDVEGLNEGENVTLADLKLPADVEATLEEDTVLVVLSIPVADVPADEEADEAEEATSEEAAE
ncbi:MAG: 50S ribosomal protein L25/general stress protein Ctc [Actinomycetaceae bacterium]|nr:50S ribosomal protein L25/general stress protein Ctc [Actinomycetaceae bacterium]